MDSSNSSKPPASDSPFRKVTAQTGTTGTLGYQGEYTDPDTGQVNMHARWYDPTTGGFSSRDSWTLNPVPSIQANRYTYAGGSPLLNTDPSGHFVCAGACVIGVGVLGAAGVGALTAEYFRQHPIDIDWGFDWEWDWGGGSSSSSSSSSTTGYDWSNSLSNASKATAAALAAQAASLATTPTRPDTGSTCRSGCRNNDGNSRYRPKADNGPGGGKDPWTPKGPRGPKKPKTPPPPPWFALIKLALNHDTPRPTTGTDPDTEHKQYVDDAFTRAQADLELTPEQLRGYFKYFPDGDAVPDTSGPPSPQPSPSTGNGGDAPRDPCSASREDRHYYGSLVDGTPTGVVALLCPQDLKPKNSRSKRPRGMNPPGYVARKDADDLWMFARTHILGDRFNGKWVKENIFTGHRGMNDPGMKRCENKMASALDAKQRVLYSGQLAYGDGREELPTGIHMTAISDSGGVLFNGVFVKNSAGDQVTC